MTTPPLPVISSPRRSRLGLWLTLGGLAAIITIGIPIFLFYRLANRFTKEYAPVAATLPAELAAAKEEGLPTTIEELRPKPPVKDADNAAPLYRKLMTVYKKRSKSEAESSFLTAHLKSPVRTAQEDAEIRAFLKSHTMELSLAEQGAKKPACDFARDWRQGFDTLFPELSTLRNGARLLLLRAALKSDENKPVPALQDVRLAANIARHASSDPLVIQALVKIAIQAAAHRQFVGILERHGDDPAVLTAARDTERALGDPIDLRHTFSGELVLSIVTYSNLSRSSNFSEKIRQQGLLIPVSDKQVQQQMADAWQARAIDYWRGIQQSIHESEGDLLAFEAGLSNIEAEESQHRFEAGYEMNGLQMSVFLPFPAKIMQIQAMAHLRQNMLALLEYKQKLGKFPDSLSDLPDSPAKTDPFTNQPLLYRKTDKGFVLYSVGNNRNDDGGSTKIVKTDDSNLPEDIVVSYP